MELITIQNNWYRRNEPLYQNFNQIRFAYWVEFMALGSILNLNIFKNIKKLINCKELISGTGNPLQVDIYEKMATNISWCVYVYVNVYVVGPNTEFEVFNRSWSQLIHVQRHS